MGARVERMPETGNDPDMDDAMTKPAHDLEAANEAMLDSDTFIAVAGTILVPDVGPDAPPPVREGEGGRRLPPPPPYGSLIATSSVAPRRVRRRAS